MNVRIPFLYRLVILVREIVWLCTFNGRKWIAGLNRLG